MTENENIENAHEDENETIESESKKETGENEKSGNKRRCASDKIKNFWSDIKILPLGGLLFLSGLLLLLICLTSCVSIFYFSFFPATEYVSQIYWLFIACFVSAFLIFYSLDSYPGPGTRQKGVGAMLSASALFIVIGGLSGICIFIALFLQKKDSDIGALWLLFITSNCFGIIILYNYTHSFFLKSYDHLKRLKKGNATEYKIEKIIKAKLNNQKIEELLDNALLEDSLKDSVKDILNQHLLYQKSLKDILYDRMKYQLLKFFTPNKNGQRQVDELLDPIFKRIVDKLEPDTKASSESQQESQSSGNSGQQSEQ